MGNLPCCFCALTAPPDTFRQAKAAGQLGTLWFRYHGEKPWASTCVWGGRIRAYDILQRMELSIAGGGGGGAAEEVEVMLTPMLYIAPHLVLSPHRTTPAPSLRTWPEAPRNLFVFVPTGEECMGGYDWESQSRRLAVSPSPSLTGTPAAVQPCRSLPGMIMVIVILLRTILTPIRARKWQAPTRPWLAAVPRRQSHPATLISQRGTGPGPASDRSSSSLPHSPPSTTSSSPIHSDSVTLSPLSPSTNRQQMCED